MAELEEEILRKAEFKKNINWSKISINFLDVTVSITKGIKNFKKKKTTLWPLFMDGVQLPQGLSHFEEAVYFLPLSSQKFLVLILSTSGG